MIEKERDLKFLNEFNSAFKSQLTIFRRAKDKTKTALIPCLCT